MSFHLLLNTATENLWEKHTVHGLKNAQALLFSINDKHSLNDLTHAVVANVPDGINAGTVEATSWQPLIWNPEFQRYELDQDQGPTTVILILG